MTGTNNQRGKNQGKQKTKTLKKEMKGSYQIEKDEKKHCGVTVTRSVVRPLTSAFARATPTAVI